MNKKKIFIIVSILAAIGLVVMLFMLPKPKTNNTAKQETSTETSTSKESSKKNDDKKNQTSKKDDKKDNKQDAKKDSKKDDTSTTSSETPATGTTSTETQNNNTGSSVTNIPTTNTTPSQPDPQPIYQTIHHDEVGHWETQVIAEAWDEPVYERKIIGNNTGTIYPNVNAFIENENGDEGYHVGDVQVGTTHHDAVTQQVWVVDQYAWDETIIVGYK